MPFSWFLAFRYLKPRRSAFSIITLLSILGVSLGVMVLIVVIGVMSGFDKMIKESILGMEPQIVLKQVGGVEISPESGNLDWRSTKKLLEKQPHVKSVHPYVYVTTLLEPGEPPPLEGEESSLNPTGLLVPGATPPPDSQPPAVPTVPEAIPAMPPSPEMEPEAAHFLGLDLSNEDQIRRIKEKMLPGGTFDIGSERIVMNVSLARKLRVGVGWTVSAFSPESIKQVRVAWRKREAAREKGDDQAIKSLDEEMDKLLAPTEFTITGLFASQQHNDYVILALDDAQSLNGGASQDLISSLAVNTADPFQARERLREFLKLAEFPWNWEGNTWIDSHEDFFNAIQNERSMMFLVLLAIIVVAAFCTMISMIIFAVQKRREIGMLRALGARGYQISGIFLSQGLVVGIFGALVGALGGLGILKFRNEIRQFLSQNFKIEIFPANIYGLPSLPAHLRDSDLWSICGWAVVLCAVAGIAPALFGFREDPARSLRGDR